VLVLRLSNSQSVVSALCPAAVPNKSIEVEQYGETKLPDSVLANVMVCLAKTREPGGLRGFACVAKDLANASLVGGAVLGLTCCLQQPKPPACIDWCL
jgi:hypothetical protein